MWCVDSLFAIAAQVIAIVFRNDKENVGSVFTRLDCRLVFSCQNCCWKQQKKRGDMRYRSRHLVQSEKGLCHDSADDVSMDVGQPVIPSSVPVGETFVIETQQVKHGRVQVVNAHRIFSRAET